MPWTLVLLPSMALFCSGVLELGVLIDTACFGPKSVVDASMLFKKRAAASSKCPIAYSAFASLVCTVNRPWCLRSELWRGLRSRTYNALK